MRTNLRGKHYTGIPWDGTPPPPSGYAERAVLEQERDFYRNLAQTAIRAMELLIMGIGDTRQGAAWEQERAVNQVKAIADNIAADLKELGPALSDVVTAAASMAAVQSASGIVMYNTRLEEIEKHLTQAREDIADLKMRLREVEALLGERGAV